MQDLMKMIDVLKKAKFKIRKSQDIRSREIEKGCFVGSSHRAMGKDTQDVILILLLTRNRRIKQRD